MDVPKTIHLQWHDEDGKEFDSPNFDGECVTWSIDAINDDDELYYHVSEIERLNKEKEWLYEELISLCFSSGRDKHTGHAEKRIKHEMKQALKGE